MSSTYLLSYLLSSGLSFWLNYVQIIKWTAELGITKWNRGARTDQKSLDKSWIGDQNEQWAIADRKRELTNGRLMQILLENGINVPAVVGVRILKSIMQLLTPRFWDGFLLTNHFTSRGKSDSPTSCMQLPGWHQAGGNCSDNRQWSVCEGRVLHHPAEAQKSISACRPHKSLWWWIQCH